MLWSFFLFMEAPDNLNPVWNQATIPFTFVLGLIVIGLLLLSGFNLVLRDKGEHEDLASFLQFCDQVEERRFRFWSRTWLLCTFSALIFYSVLPGISFLVYCALCLLFWWSALLILWETKVIQRVTAAQLFSLGHIVYIHATCFGAGPDAYEMFANYHGLDCVLLLSACTAGWQWTLWMLVLSLSGMTAFFIFPPSTSFFCFPCFKSAALLVPMLSALTSCALVCKLIYDQIDIRIATHRSFDAKSKVKDDFVSCVSHELRSPVRKESPRK